MTCPFKNDPMFWGTIRSCSAGLTINVTFFSKIPLRKKGPKMSAPIKVRGATPTGIELGSYIPTCSP